VAAKVYNENTVTMKRLLRQLAGVFAVLHYTNTVAFQAVSRQPFLSNGRSASHSKDSCPSQKTALVFSATASSIRRIQSVMGGEMGSSTCLHLFSSPKRITQEWETDDESDQDGDSEGSSAQQQQPKPSSSTTPTPQSNAAPPCVIKVLGVGGGGGNAVNRMIQTRIEGVSFWAINTDAQALAKSLAPNVLNIGRALTRGLGAGGIPDVGEAAAMENAQEIERICKGADMVFITAGMGGGTGSGAAPVVAEIAKKDCGCLTVGVVTKPFAFEGKKRLKQAEKAIENLRKHVDTVIVVSNDKLLQIVPDNTPVTDAFLVADDILRQGVVGISEIILKTGLVNVGKLML